MGKKTSPYLTWGCADDLTCRLKKTLYCSDENDCYESSSAALTDVAVSMMLDVARNPKRKLSHRYASSLSRQLPISPCAIMMSILYAERLRQVNPGFLNRVASSDIYVVSVMVASKYLTDEGEDEEVFNDEWAECAGLAVSTMNKLEREFLSALDWNLYVDPAEFIEFCSSVETKIALKYGLKRGWFSYTDLTQFLVASQYQTILKDIIEHTVKIISGCTLLYGVSLSLLATSFVWQGANNHSQKIETSERKSDFWDGSAIGHCYSEECDSRLRHRGYPDVQDQVDDHLRTDAIRRSESDLALIFRNQASSLAENGVRENCSCSGSRECYERGFHAYQPDPGSLIPENVYSNILCKWKLKDPAQRCPCDSVKLKPVGNSIGKFSRKKHHLNHIAPMPKLLGLVIM